MTGDDNRDELKLLFRRKQSFRTFLTFYQELCNHSDANFEAFLLVHDGLKALTIKTTNVVAKNDKTSEQAGEGGTSEYVSLPQIDKSCHFVRERPPHSPRRHGKRKHR